MSVLIGAHVPVAGGYDHALEYALSVGCECAQVFAKSPRQWRGAAIDPDAASRFADARRAVSFGPLFTHAAYLLNLATCDDILWERSIQALVDELTRASVLGAEALVTHVGSDRRQDATWAASRVAEAVCRAYAEFEATSPRPVRLLLENTAGAGNSFGSSFEQLGDTIRRADLPVARLGVCLDTCHAHAFGIALDSQQGWARAMDSIGAHVGVERLGLIHANDCMFPAGTKRDRHAWIGDGYIGYPGFRAMFDVAEREAIFDGLCVVTEMPGDPPHKDEENLRRLSELRATARKS